MFWVWIAYLWHKLVWLTLPPEHIIPQIDVNAPCPGCGHRNGKIRCIQFEGARPGEGKIMIQHICQVCDANFFETPVGAARAMRGHIINDNA